MPFMPAHIKGILVFLEKMKGGESQQIAKRDAWEFKKTKLRLTR
jgi:hypothetical protein